MMSKSTRKKSILKRNNRIWWDTWRRRKIPMMMTSKMMTISHPFHAPCLSSGVTIRLKGKKAKEVGWWSCLIVGPGRIKNLIRRLNWSGDKKNKEKENSISKSKLKPKKKLPLTKFSIKLEGSSSWDKKSNTKRKRKRRKNCSKILEKLLKLLWLTITKDL